MLAWWRRLPWQRQVIVQGASIGAGIFLFGSAVGALAYRIVKGQ